MEKPRPLTEDQIAHLEALVRSPVYGSLVALLAEYRFEVYSQLANASDPKDIYRLQGRLLGLGALENLPRLHAERQEKKRKLSEEKTAEEAQKKKRPSRRSL